jgi:hypothetical protein
MARAPPDASSPRKLDNLAEAAELLGINVRTLTDLVVANAYTDRSPTSSARPSRRQRGYRLWRLTTDQIEAILAGQA